MPHYVARVAPMRILPLVLAVVLLLTGHAARLEAQSRGSFSEWQASVLADAIQAKPVVACADLIALTDYGLSIISATMVPASAETPQYCRVYGQIQPDTKFEVNLPAVWNRRLYMFGNGGFAGETLDSRGRTSSVQHGLARGFAVAQSNMGHDATVEPLATFAVNSQKFIDYAFRATHVTAVTAKRILQTYYGIPSRRAYFDGCSSGGRQGLISAQRFPEDFDGILVGAPVLNFTGTMISYLTNQRALTSAPLTADKLKVLADAVYAKCDAVDGLADGLIDDPRRCTFTPATDLPRCANEVDGPACYTSAQVRTVETVYGGTKRNGADFFPGQPLGGEVAQPGSASGSGWISWIVPQTPGGRSVETDFSETFFRYMAFGRPNLKYDTMTFNLDTDYDKLQGTRTLLDATDTDLSRFKARGGKILSYFGWADTALNPLVGIRYYEDVAQRLGPTTTGFYRLFMVPGMFHCGGGVGVSSFDAMTPLVAWVEKGTAPQALTGAKVVGGKVVRTRPLCPYPQVAQYKGTGSIDEAANFACVAPTR
jgi:hypothetical protein